MNSRPAVLLATLLLGPALAPADPPPDRVRHLLEPGCSVEPPFHGEGARLSDMPLSEASVRLVIAAPARPGTLVVTIDSGTNVFASPDRSPFFLASLGGWAGTCTIRMPLEQCEEAAGVREQLTALQIPVGAGMERPFGFVALDGTTYTLEFNGGGNRNVVTYGGGPGHPLEQPLDAARDALRPCWQEAESQLLEFVQAREAEAR